MATTQSGCVMQPYFLPYLGYFALLEKVDTFVIFDSVQFTKRGWINRNRIKSNQPDGWSYITIPVRKAPQTALIQEIELSEDNQWKQTLQKTLIHQYKRAPYFDEMHQILTPIWSETRYLADLNTRLLQIFAKYLNLSCNWVRSSELSESHPHLAALRNQDLILEICKVLGIATYWNLPGGIDLYTPAAFKAHQIDLRFVPNINLSALKTRFPKVSDLSILDICMWHSAESTREILAHIWKMESPEA